MATWCDKHGFDPRRGVTDLARVPFLPVNIFKRLSLCSVPETEVVRVLTSSATSSQVPGRISLDQTTRNRQMRALAAILSHRIGGERRPFIVLDVPPDSRKRIRSRDLGTPGRNARLPDRGDPQTVCAPARWRTGCRSTRRNSSPR